MGIIVHIVPHGYHSPFTVLQQQSSSARCTVQFGAFGRIRHGCSTTSAGEADRHMSPTAVVAVHERQRYTSLGSVRSSQKNDDCDIFKRLWPVA